jgi:hypothetical protein
MTKNFNFGEVINVSGSVGYGFDLLKAKYKEQDGLFYGITASLKELPQMVILVEHDSRYWNSGIKLTLFNHLQILAVLREFENFEGALSYRFQLK